MDGPVASSSRHEGLIRYARDTWDRALSFARDRRYRRRQPPTDNGPHPFVFDVFAEDIDGLVSDSQPPVKQRRRASSASSSACPGEVRTPLGVELQHDVGPCADSDQEEILDDHEWRTQVIIGERQTLSGPEYKVNVEKTLWLPRVKLDTKLVRRYRAEQQAVTRVSTRWSSRLQWMAGL